ncbi:MAG: ABC transporter permease [Deltaproteobacteria bacterium]|nr:ABC transporter permease [Deltaproteobacteria bacterium]MBW2154919.1 ABC transporter permease [Deltaproteobacteria bacterium]
MINRNDSYLSFKSIRSFSSRTWSFLHFSFYLMKRNRLSLFGAVFIGLFVMLGILGPMITVYDPVKPDIRSISLPPSTKHWMGTNALGMDVFTRIVHAARIDLSIAVFAVLGATITGTIYGMFSAYYGRWLDEVMMRVLDSIQAFPTIILAIAIAAVLGPSTRNVIIVLVIVNSPIYARLVRSLALSVKKAQYVDAARAVGNGNLTIIFKHILPNCMGPVYVTGSINIGWSVLMAASLSFIGLGVQSPTPEWGLMINEGARYMVLGEWWMALFPGLFIFLFVLSASLLGDGLQDVFDPKRR